jgi:hypothetical protein
MTKKQIEHSYPLFFWYRCRPRDPMRICMLQLANFTLPLDKLDQPLFSAPRHDLNAPSCSQHWIRRTGVSLMALAPDRTRRNRSASRPPRRQQSPNAPQFLPNCLANTESHEVRADDGHANIDY